MGTIKGSSRRAIDRHKLVREKSEYRDDSVFVPKLPSVLTSNRDCGDLNGANADKYSLRCLYILASTLNMISDNLSIERYISID
jgi:hypothetical protein